MKMRYFIYYQLKTEEEHCLSVVADSYDEAVIKVEKEVNNPYFRILDCECEQDYIGEDK